MDLSRIKNDRSILEFSSPYNNENVLKHAVRTDSSTNVMGERGGKARTREALENELLYVKGSARWFFASCS